MARYEISGELPTGGYIHPESGKVVGEWCIINSDVTTEEGTSKSRYARPRIICIVAGGGSRYHAQILCDAMNNNDTALAAPVEDLRWKL